VAFLQTEAVDFQSKQEKEKLTPSSTIVLDPQLDQLPTIFITNRIEASQRILGQTTEPLIKHIISICDPSEEPPPGYTQVPHRLRLEFDDITTPLDDPEDVLAAPADILKVIDFTQAMRSQRWGCSHPLLCWSQPLDRCSPDSLCCATWRWKRRGSLGLCTKS
jgi:hypothetical protein